MIRVLGVRPGECAGDLLEATDRVSARIRKAVRTRGHILSERAGCAGDTANRLRRAVERSVPFAMLGLTILILWYAANGTSDTDLATARTRAPGTARRTTSASTTCSSPSAGPE